MKKGYRIIVLLILSLFLVLATSCSSLKTDNSGTSQKIVASIDARYGLNTNEVESYDNISSSDVATVVANIVMPATVEITATINYSYTYTYGGFMGGHSSRTVNDTITSKATGFFINEDGYLLTNAHVISIENESRYTDLKYTSREIMVNYADSDVYFEVEVVTYDIDLDLAILKLKESSEIENLKYVTFFNMTSPSSDKFNESDAVKLYYGEAVVAIGNANGYGISVTQGVISAPYRTFTSSGVSVAAIQTDAAINEGNSGGPLANKYGAVVGINSFKTVTSTSESLGFAIPSYVVMGYIDSVCEENGYIITYYYTNERAYTNNN